MIKVYLDWNVFSQMKNGYNNKLLKILSNKDKFIIPYSSAHISDIQRSFSNSDKQKQMINEDFEFISKMTDNLFLSIVNKKLINDNIDPTVFNTNIDTNDVLKDFSLDWLEKTLCENEATKEIGEKYLELIRAIPIDLLAKPFENPESANTLNKLYPGLKENLTMDGFVESFKTMVYNLTEKENYKELRNILQDGLNINKDRITNSSDPYKIIDKAYSKFDSTNNVSTNNYNQPKWYSEIITEYNKLDMHGYHQDKIEVKEGKRKQTFTNTIEDANHSAFATTCNFYIINDNKSFWKTKKVFEKLKINTLVFKPEEFIDYYNKFLSFDNFNHYVNTFDELLKSKDFYEEKDNNSILRIYHHPYFIFDFFNKTIISQSLKRKTTTILLSKFFPSNYRITYIKEINKLIEKLIEIWGSSLCNKKDIEESENLTNNWEGRKWKVENLYFDLNLN